MNRSRVTGDLASQGNIFVDIANDRVGIGSTIPTQKLEVTGTVKATAFVGSGANLTGIDTDLVSDTSPQLGGDLDVQASKITTSTSNGNVKIEPNGTGVVEVRGAGGNDGTLQLNCSAQSHGIKLKSPPHSAGQSYTLTFPSSIVNNGFLKTDSSGNLSFAAVNTDVSNDTSPTLGGTLDAGTFNIFFGDGNGTNTGELRFGSGTDLRIYHDGSHSYIHDGGTGNLKVRSNNFRVSNADESKMSATFVPAGAVTLYNNNSPKFETTSSGIDVTGTVTADNQIVLNSGDSTPARIDLYCEVSNAHYTRLQAPAHSTYSGNVTVTIPNASGNLAVLANAANNRIVTATGTHGMTGESGLTYDGSTLAVTGDVTMTNTSSNPQLALISANNGISEIQFGDGADAVRGNIIYRSGSAGDALCFNGYNNTERFRINSSGQLLINTTGTESGTNTKLSVCATGSAGSNPTLLDNVVAAFRATGSSAHAASIAVLAGNTGSSAVHFGDTDNDVIGRLLYNHTSGNTSDYFGFYLQGTERFRIQGNGNLCIANSVDYTAGAKVEIRDTIGGGGGTMLILNEIGSSGANEGGHIEWRSGSDKQSDQCRIGQAANGTGSGSNFFIATNSGDTGSSTERLRIDQDGKLLLGTSSVYNASGGGNMMVSVKKDAASRTDLSISNQSTGDNAGAALVLGAHGQDFILESTGSGNSTTGAGIFTISDGATERLRIDGSGHISQGGGATPSSTNGNVGLKFGIKSALNNVIIGETTNGSMNGIILESRITGRSGGARCSQVIMGDGVITFETASSGGDVAERVRITSAGSLLVGGTNATANNGADNLIIGSTSSGTNGITIKSGTTGYGRLYFSDADSTSAAGQIEYHHGNEHMDFYGNGMKMMRIDATEDEGQLRFTPNVDFSGTRNTNIVRETFILNTSESSNQAYHDNHHMSFGQTSGNWSEGTSGHDTSWGLMWHYSANASATRQCRAGIAFDHKGTEQFKIWSAYGDIVFYQDLANGGSETAETCDTECARFDGNGHFVPGSNNARDLGTSSKKWRNIHVMDMHFSNDGGDPNCVDGTTGDWTLQEGADGIYMINNKNGKKYEMMLKEVQ